jgi:hypothetical protein
MNIFVTSPPARTDAAPSPAVAADQLPPATVRRLGLGLVAGAGIWSAASFVYGFTPDTEVGIKATDLTGFAFQLGVLSLLQLQLRTRAIGTSRKAVGFLKVERVLLALAMAWSLIHGLVPSVREDAWLVALDVFWPLSMLGMFAIGVKIAFAGRWRGPARFYPLVAESWAVVSIPAMGIFGPSVGNVVGATHLVVGYVTLGLLIALRPGLVVPQER